MIPRFWIVDVSGNWATGPFPTPQAAGKAWPSLKGPNPPTYRLKVETAATGRQDAAKADVEAALGAMMRARGNTRRP